MHCFLLQTHHGSQVLNSSGTVQVPLISGNVINIPVERITVTTEPEINISEEMSKTTLWKTIVANESFNSLTNLEASSQKRFVYHHTSLIKDFLKYCIFFYFTKVLNIAK